MSGLVAFDLGFLTIWDGLGVVIVSQGVCKQLLLHIVWKLISFYLFWNTWKEQNLRFFVESEKLIMIEKNRLSLKPCYSSLMEK